MGNTMGIIQSVETDAGLAIKWVENEAVVFEGFFTTDVVPYLKQFLSILSSQIGQAALKAAPAALALIATGGFGAAAASVGATVVGTVAADAVPDAQTVLQAAQAALQVAKVGTNTVTPADTTAVATIQTAVDTQTSAQSQS
jgi:hypothetical protein